MTQHCINCVHVSVCIGHSALQDLIVSFKRLAINQTEKENCGVTHTTEDLMTALGGACTAWREELPCDSE